MKSKRYGLKDDGMTVKGPKKTLLISGFGSRISSPLSPVKSSNGSSQRNDGIEIASVSENYSAFGVTPVFNKVTAARAAEALNGVWLYAGDEPIIPQPLAVLRLTPVGFLPAAVTTTEITLSSPAFRSHSVPNLAAGVLLMIATVDFTATPSLRLTLSDGTRVIHAVTHEPLLTLDMNAMMTPQVGQRVWISGGAMLHGKLLLTHQSCRIIPIVLPKQKKGWSLDSGGAVNGRGTPSGKSSGLGSPFRPRPPQGSVSPGGSKRPQFRGDAMMTTVMGAVVAVTESNFDQIGAATAAVLSPHSGSASAEWKRFLIASDPTSSPRILPPPAANHVSSMKTDTVISPPPILRRSLSHPKSEDSPSTTTDSPAESPSVSIPITTSKIPPSATPQLTLASTPEDTPKPGIVANSSDDLSTIATAMTVMSCRSPFRPPPPPFRFTLESTRSNGNMRLQCGVPKNALRRKDKSISSSPIASSHEESPVVQNRRTSASPLRATNGPSSRKTRSNIPASKIIENTKPLSPVTAAAKILISSPPSASISRRLLTGHGNPMSSSPISPSPPEKPSGTIARQRRQLTTAVSAAAAVEADRIAVLRAARLAAKGERMITEMKKSGGK